MSAEHRLASFVSGSGTTMEKIGEAIRSEEIPNMELACVISSRSKVEALQRARGLGVPEEDIIILRRMDFLTNEGEFDIDRYGETVFKELKRRGVTVITNNGNLLKVPDNVVEEYEGVNFNQHNGPPHYFGGEGMYGRRVLAATLAFARMIGIGHTEVVVHRVTKKYDEGPIVKSALVEILPDDDVESLKERALPVEYRVQIGLLQDFVEGIVTEVGSRFPRLVPPDGAVISFFKQIGKNLYPKG